MDQQVQQEERTRFGEEEGGGPGLIPVPQGEDGRCAWLTEVCLWNRRQGTDWRAASLYPSPCWSQCALPLVTSIGKLMLAFLIVTLCVLLAYLCNKQTAQKFWRVGVGESNLSQ